ncbi:hypothetical protein SAMN06298221_1025 [Sphaerochaeta associata]|jgi:hypothetical protein|nr:hypothetical protein SAMN06298221_1025 [Sphaerochaeta associata]
MGLLGVAKRLFYSKRKIKALLGGRIDCFFLYTLYITC